MTSCRPKTRLSITCKEFRSRLLHFLADNLHFEQNLNLRLLVTCSVDEGDRETLVIDENLKPEARSVEMDATPPLKLALASSLLQMVLKANQNNVIGNSASLPPLCKDAPASKRRCVPYRRRCVKYPWLGRAMLHAPKRPKNFNCNQCEETYAQLMELTKHTETAHGSFKCNVCQARFSLRSNLQRHSYRHLDLKPFACAVCEQAFYRKELLLDHVMKTHPDQNVGPNVITHLTSAECLDYVESMWMRQGDTVQAKTDDEDDEEETSG
ncbi:hypothetical protein Ciccas_011765 [Cichlidogyrus casuarinus]|uniref:C2H2-type domain-containing protein n=1 Tax=Cichlidogyrus casuarinus TaxID=1844966 RepID=A0ABD2PSH9_9PLAT